jgi:hypothetical protein
VTLVEECIAAYGGLERWRAADAVDMRVSARGLAFATKGRFRLLRDVHARVGTRGQRVELFDWPCAGTTALFTRAECQIGECRRAHPRWGRRWDDLDFLAFAGAALWTYVSLPFVLADWAAEELPGRRLRFRAPDGIRTHCREQTVQLDRRGLIVRHEYTAEAFGAWARAVHRSSRFVTADGLPMPTRRRVRPRPLGPVIVSIDVSHAGYVPAPFPAVSSPGPPRSGERAHVDHRARHDD